MATRRRMVYELDAEESKALDAYRKLTAEQKRALAETEKGAQAAKKQGGAVSYLKGEWKALVGTALGFIGVNQLIQQGIGLLRDYDERLKKISETQTKTAGGAVPFAALQAPEDVSRVLRESATLAAKEGVSPEEGFNIFQRAQSVYGTFELAKPQAIATMRLAKLTQDTEMAAETIKTAKALGMTQEEFTSVLVGMAASSAGEERLFTKVSPHWGLFTGEEGKPEKYFGAAVTNILSQEVPNKELQTYVKAAARTLTKVEAPLPKEISATAEEWGRGKPYTEMSNAERLRAIQQHIQTHYGEVTAETIQQAGIVEQSEVQAMSALLKPERLQALQALLSEGPEMGETYNIEERLEAIQQEPIIRQKYLEEQTAATAEAFAMMGPESARARERAARVRAIGAERSFGWDVDVETGEAGGWRRIWEFIRAENYPVPQYETVGPAYQRPEGVSEEKRLEEALERQMGVLREIAENTKSDKRPKPSEAVSVRPEVE